MKVFKKVHLSFTKKLYERGNYVCHEGEESNALFIVGQGEFEVIKTVDTYEVPEFFRMGNSNIKNEVLPKHKLIS